MGSRRWFISGAAAVALLVALGITVHAGRYEQHKKQFSEGPHCGVVNATFFGSDGNEEFVAAGELEDGTIVAVGNAWGPQFPQVENITVVGRGRHSGAPQTREKTKRGRTKILARTDCPDMAGMLVFYTRGLGAVKSVLRMDWGVARFSDGVATLDGKHMYVAGVAGPHFSSLGGSGSGAFIMRISDSKSVDWAKMLGNMGTPQKVMVNKDNTCYVEVKDGRTHTLYEVTEDGTVTKLMSRKPPNRTQFHAVDPTDGGILYGGDRNTHTGQEPWRQPYLYKYDREGNKVWTLWENSPKGLRDGHSPGQGLVSDSAISAISFAPNGDFVCGGWSDGGNSVFTRQPTDPSKKVPQSPLNMQTWGAKGANSNGWIMRINRNHEVVSETKWSAFIPEGFMGGGGNWPNGVSIKKIVFLATKEVAITGGAATGLIPTPNAFYQRPADYEGKYGGKYVTVFRPDLSNATFSSYLPGYTESNIAFAKKGVLVVGRTRKDDGKDIAEPPVGARAPQKEFGGGTFDAHIIYIASPSASVSVVTQPSSQPRTTRSTATQRSTTTAASTRNGAGSRPKAKTSGKNKYAAKYVDWAKRYISSGRKDLAKDLLEKVVRNYPDTEGAAEARKLLKDL